MMDDTIDLQRINAGRTATIFKCTDHQVLKLFRSTFPEHGIDEEYKIGTYLYNLGLDIPRTYARMHFEGSHGIVFEYIPGQSMLQKLASAPWKVFSYAKQMARLHWKIHSTRISDAAEIPSIKESLTSKILRVRLLTSFEKATIISHLSTLKKGNAICHGDFHPDNIIVSTDRLVTVDWLTERIGNPIADVARTWLLLTMGTLPDHKTAFENMLAKYLRDTFCRAYVSEYRRLSNFESSEFDKWKLPVAAARLIENVSDQENENLLKWIRMKLQKDH